MDFFFNEKKKDKRIFLSTVQVNNKDIEVYPEGSFPIDTLLIHEYVNTSLLTSQTATPNNFYVNTQDKNFFKIIATSTKSKAGRLSGFWFYESFCFSNDYKLNQSLYMYQSLSVLNNIRFSVFLNVKNYKIKTTGGLQPAALWPEREVSDMNGVFFQGAKDSRRLLLDYKTQRGVLTGVDYTKLPKYSSFFDFYYL